MFNSFEQFLFEIPDWLKIIVIPAVSAGIVAGGGFAWWVIQLISNHGL